MQYKGRLKLPGDRGNGIAVDLRLDDLFVELASDGEFLGRWRVDDIGVERVYSDTFSLDLAGEEMLFVADDPLAFAYEGVSAIVDLSNRLRKRRRSRLLPRKRREGTRPAPLEPPVPEGAAVAAEPTGRMEQAVPAPDAERAAPRPTPLRDAVEEARRGDPEAPGSRPPVEETVEWSREETPRADEDVPEPSAAGEEPVPAQAQASAGEAAEALPEEEADEVADEVVEEVAFYTSSGSWAMDVEAVNLSEVLAEALAPPAPEGDASPGDEEAREPAVEEPLPEEVAEAPEPVEPASPVPALEEPLPEDVEEAPAAPGPTGPAAVVDEAVREEGEAAAAEERGLVDEDASDAAPEPEQPEPPESAAPSEVETPEVVEPGGQVEDADGLAEEVELVEAALAADTEPTPSDAADVTGDGPRALDVEVVEPSEPEPAAESVIPPEEAAEWPEDEDAVVAAEGVPSGPGRHLGEGAADRNGHGKRRIFARRTRKSEPDHEHDYQESKTVGGIIRRVCAVCGHVSFAGEDVYQGWS